MGRARITHEFVKQTIESNVGYTLLSNEIVNAKTKLHIRHLDHQFTMNWNHWSSHKNRCPICTRKKAAIKMRTPYATVKQSIESIPGYKLLTKEEDYVDKKTKITIECDKQHIFTKTYKEFMRRGHCTIGECLDSCKLDYEFVKKEIESVNGYKLLSEVYVGNNEKMKIWCPVNSHIFELSYAKFMARKQCPCTRYERSGSKKRNSYEYVKEQVEKRIDYKFIDENYKSCRTKILIECPNGHEFRMGFHNFTKNMQNCPKCSNNGSSKPEREIQAYIVEHHPDVIMFRNDRTMIIGPKGRFLELDVWMPGIKKAIEYGADYYHSDKYKKKCDVIKVQWCKDNNIDYMVIHEKIWVKNKDWEMIDKFIKGDTDGIH